MPENRRQFLATSSRAVVSAGIASCVLGAARPSAAEDDEPLIIDTHQHLWNRDQLSLPWLEGAPEVLRQNYGPEEYAAATQGLAIRAVYMEVDVAESDHDAEAEYVIGLCKRPAEATRAAVIGGRPASEGFGKYVARHAASGVVKGVRQVLHGDGTPAGFCLQPEFIRGVRTLGEQGLSFDLCMRPNELGDGLKLAEACPDTRFIVDHCGNADPKAFGKLRGREPATHMAATWQRSIEALAKRSNVICKISGIVARAPAGWDAADLAPIVDHCLDAFGPQRVIFGGDWPVCLLGAPLRAWVDALRAIVSARPAADQRRLWSENAIAFYGLDKLIPAR